LPGESIYVFDACAVIALLKAEPGSEVVEALLQEEGSLCIVHAISACEIYYDLYRRDGQELADGLGEVLEGLGFELDEDVPSALWQAAGRLKVEWKRVSLADCFALARAISVAGTLVTSDHNELDRIAQAQVCPIQFIR
jgi:predicted nucleic acid-binding protein